MRATWEPAAARIAASAPQIAAALSVLADSLVRLNASATEATAGCLSESCRPQHRPPHAAARLRVQARQRWRRYQSAASLPRPQEHPAHCALHRTCAYKVQGVLARLTGFNQFREQRASITTLIVLAALSARADLGRQEVPRSNGPSGIRRRNRPRRGLFQKLTIHHQAN
jgi:hypothetical protein